MINWQDSILFSENLGLKATDLMVIPFGDTASRPVDLEDGIIRINTDICPDPILELYFGGTWYSPCGSGGCTDELEIRFHVGDFEYPQDDENILDTSTLTTPIDLTNKRIKVYRQGERQFEGDFEYGINYDTSTGIITFYPNLALGEPVIVEAEDITECFTLYTPPPPPLVEAVIFDDGYYNGFPFPIYEESDGAIYSLWKRSTSHPVGGDIMISVSKDGGLTWDASNVVIDGDNVVATNISFGKIGRRWFFAWQEAAGVFLEIKVSHSDDRGTTWSSPVVLDTWSNESALSPFPPMVMPSGKILFGVYQWNTGLGETYFSEFTTDDNGLSYDLNEAFITRTGTVYPDEGCDEFCRIITDNTGVDATCKMVIVARSVLYSSYNHFSSSDGGATWTHNFDHLIDGFNPQVEKSPLLVFKHSSGTFYLIDGNREGTNYHGAYIEISAGDLYDNDIINSLTVVDFYPTTYVNADDNGAAIDWGYPIAFEDFEGKIWAHVYDTSLEDPADGVTRRCLVKQIKVKD